MDSAISRGLVAIILFALIPVGVMGWSFASQPVEIEDAVVEEDGEYLWEVEYSLEGNGEETVEFYHSREPDIDAVEEETGDDVDEILSAELVTEDQHITPVPAWLHSIIMLMIPLIFGFAGVLVLLDQI